MTKQTIIELVQLDSKDEAIEQVDVGALADCIGKFLCIRVKVDVSKLLRP